MAYVHMYTHTHTVHTFPTRACECLHPYACAQGRNLNRITSRCFKRSVALAINTLPGSDPLGFTSEHLPHYIPGHGSQCGLLNLLESAQSWNFCSWVHHESLWKWEPASLGKATTLPIPSLCLPGYFLFTLSYKAPLGSMNLTTTHIALAMCQVLV